MKEGEGGGEGRKRGGGKAKGSGLLASCLANKCLMRTAGVL